MWGWAVLVAVAVVVVVFPRVHGYEGCTIRYGRRGCFHRVLTGVLVSCDGYGKEKRVPHNIPQDTVYMSLVNFKFGQLMKANFTRFPTVECLTIMDSGVSGVDYDTFEGMDGLHELVLENTNVKNGDLSFMSHPSYKGSLLTLSESPSVTRLDSNATKTLHQIKSLNMGGNSIEYVSPKLFPELRSIERLDLSRNSIKDLDWRMFSELSKLNKLYLDGNRFQTIPDTMFATFFAVKELTLAENPFHCNCKLRWLREFFDNAVDKKLDFSQVTCASPRAAKMGAFGSLDFTCSEPSGPTISWIKHGEDRYEVNCSSKADPSPTLRFMLPDQRVMITPPSSDLSLVNTVTPQILTYGGVVECRATNSEGERVVTETLPVLNSAPRHSLGGALLLAAVLAISGLTLL